MKKGTRPTRSRKQGEVTFDTVRALALSFPGVEEGTSYGTPAFRVGGKMLARFHQDGESLVLKVEFVTREVLLGARPETFYVTDHYRCWPLMLVRLTTARIEDLQSLFEDAWKLAAPKRLLAEFEKSREST
ncbi:MAG TPA: MmcQ/YjbR family DNA-binding protein [Blastocatellia bacterium]|jgi:hypothetical protein|nr:MmcQ/YjbR family DNA-binding protein [Blastocatellia bacterium]